MQAFVHLVSNVTGRLLC